MSSQEIGSQRENLAKKLENISVASEGSNKRPGNLMSYPISKKMRTDDDSCSEWLQKNCDIAQAMYDPYNQFIGFEYPQDLDKKYYGFLYDQYPMMEIDDPLEHKPKTDKQKQAAKAGRTDRQKDASNTNIKPCGPCSRAGVYDEDHPHANSKSKHCPFHSININEFLKQELGNHRRFVRKIGLDTIIKPNAVRGTADFKRVFMNKTNALVDYVREVGVKLHLFVHYFVLRQLEDNQPLTSSIFAQNFFYSCLQRVTNARVTNTNPKIPVDDINRIFNEYQTRFPHCTVTRPDGTPACANALASLTVESAATFSNHITENFEDWFTRYLKLRIRESVQDISADSLKKISTYLYKRCCGDERVVWPRSIQRSQDLDAVIDGIVESTNIGGPIPASPYNLSRHTHLYLPFVSQILQHIEHYNDDQEQNANEVQTEATYHFGKLHINNINESKTMGRRRKARLIHTFIKCINKKDLGLLTFGDGISEESQNYLRNTAEETINRIRASITYNNEISDDVTPSVSIKDCFLPELYTIVKKMRLFSLFPHRKLTKPYTYIDIGTLCSILVQVRAELRLPARGDCRILPQDENVGPNNPVLDRNHYEAKQFARFFDFSKVKLAIGQNGRTNKPQVKFTNLIRTDGYGIDFIFAESIGSAEEYEHDAYITDYSDFDQTAYRLWGLDPGLTSVYVASDGSDRLDNSNADLPHETRQMTTAEFYSRAGYKKTNNRIRQYKDAPNESQSTMTQLETELPSFKTANLTVYTESLTQYFERLPRMLSFYDNRFTGLRFLNYRGRQHAVEELSNIIVTGGKKYNKLGMKQRLKEPRIVPKPVYSQPRRPQKDDPTTPPARNEHKEKYVSSPFYQDDRIPLVAFGDGCFPQSKRGNVSGLVKTCYKSLKKAEQDGLLSVVKVDEYLTSQVCSRCGERELLHVDLDGESMYSVLHCNNCQTMWQRDINASRNIHYISKTHIRGGERPQEFAREEEPQ